MLVAIESGENVTTIPHSAKWAAWRSRLSDAQWSAIRDELNRRIGEGEIHTSGWIPGADWSGTPFHAIYQDACLGNAMAAGLCFGIAVWVVLMEHPQKWSFGRYQLDNIPIRSMTYFRVHD
jgi:hypothetical protein